MKVCCIHGNLQCPLLAESRHFKTFTDVPYRPEANIARCAVAMTVGPFGALRERLGRTNVLSLVIRKIGLRDLLFSFHFLQHSENRCYRWSFA